jgi:hypothetical protein
MVKNYHLWSCHAKLSKKNNPMYFFMSTLIFLIKKRGFVDFLVKVLTFGQTIDFLIKILTLLTYAKVREIRGQKLE